MIIICLVVCLAASTCSGGGARNASQSTSQSAAQSSSSTQTHTTTSSKASSKAKGEAKAKKDAASSAAKKKATGTLTVHFVDVGQGDGILVEFPDSKTLVIDTAAGGEYAMNDQMARDNRDTIDWMVATHPDADHIGGLASLIRTHPVKSLWAPAANSSTRTYTNFLETVADAGLTIHTAAAGKTIAQGAGYSITLCWPPKGAYFSDSNDYSAVVLVTFGSKKFLFTGDAPVYALKQANCGQVDVLKVSHHGSASGTDMALASELSPSVAVLSYGLTNSYGHPTQWTIDALKGVGAKIYGTGAQGTVTVTSDGKTIHVKTQHSGTVVAASKNAGANSRY